MNFTKWHGLGNDFIILDATEVKVDGAESLAKRMCDRHFGIGADGLILIEVSAVADFKMRIINSDGSEPEMCGNGLRCAAKYISDNLMTDKTKITVETLGGIMEPEILDNGLIKVNMGAPQYIKENVTISVEGEEIIGTEVSMGNPHYIMFGNTPDDDTLTALGPKIEKHTNFPHKTNVEFVEVKDGKHLRMRVWERGAGKTLACGTGACAAAVAAVMAGKAENEVTVTLDGGDLNISWGGKGEPVFMTGPAVKVFNGEYYD